MISRSAFYQIFNKFVFSPDQKTLTSLFTFLTSQKHVLFCSDSSVFSNQLNSRNIYSIEIRKPTPFIHVSLFSNITNDNFEDSCRYMYTYVEVKDSSYPTTTPTTALAG